MRNAVCLTAVACAAALSCADPLSPESVLGTWDLVSFNGDPVPGIVSRVNGDVCEYGYDTIVLVSVTETRLDGVSGRFEDTWKWQCEGWPSWREREMVGEYDLNVELGTLILYADSRAFWEFAVNDDEMVLTRSGSETDAGVQWRPIDDVLVFRKR